MPLLAARRDRGGKGARKTGAQRPTWNSSLKGNLDPKLLAKVPVCPICSGRHFGPCPTLIARKDIPAGVESFPSDMG